MHVDVMSIVLEQEPLDYDMHTYTCNTHHMHKRIIICMDTHVHTHTYILYSTKEVV